MALEKRTRCRQCNYLSKQCICRWIPSLSTRLRVIVIQDPKEAKHAKNTVALLCLGLPLVKCISSKDKDRLNEVLSALEKEKWRLIFPTEKSLMIETLSKNAVTNIEGIILLDATWRKAKKIYFTEELLQGFDTLSFDNPPACQYDIRKSPNELSLSTLEACAYTVEKLTGDSMQPLRDFMVAAQEWQWREQPPSHRQPPKI